MFAIYLADAVGYTGAVGIVLYKDFFATHAGSAAFFTAYTYVMALVGAVCITGSGVYFLASSRTRCDASQRAPACSL